MNKEALNLKAFNMYGGFNQEGNEYHILNTKTPVPWCNIMANEHFGTIVSSYGTVYSYYKNSQSFKISNWCNDWISFKEGEKFEGIYDKNYNLVYGFGYTKVLQEDDEVEKELDIFISSYENIKLQRIKLKNLSNSLRKVKISYSIDPVMGVVKDVNRNYILCKEINNGIELKNPYSIEFSNCISYITVLAKSKECNVIYDEKNYKVTIEIDLFKEESAEFTIILGCTENVEDIEKIKKSFDSVDAIEREYKNTIEYWKKLVVKNMKLDDEYLNIMANGWLLYQTIVCRLFARSGFYQSGGAIGYRDQLQDTLALISTWPERTRQQIVLHSSKQFEQGDVLHWWHEHSGAGIRTYFSDDYLWLPYVLSEYVTRTGDISVLDEKTPYLEDKPMNGKREVYDVYRNIEKYDTVYEHAKKAINYGLSRVNEETGILKIGDGDWNDGFSNIRGESVWLTFFMINVLEKFVYLANLKFDYELVKKYEKKREKLKESILKYTWDTDHFVRAFFENGQILGSYSNNECKVDLISQAWAVIAMKEYPEVHNKLVKCLETADKYLVDRKLGIVKLLYPAFNNNEVNNPGYIRAYVPGIRENGGQYTHASVWLAKAYFEMNDYKKGKEILKMINPISHSDTKEKADVYMVEPYVVAADIYSNEEHPGRGGWTWYTGSSGWMYKVIEDYLSDNKM
ncbi:MAG: GH36-type glycosyl hydrolase domain-containing protein [Clostridia bacterium]